MEQLNIFDIIQQEKKDKYLTLKEAMKLLSNNDQFRSQWWEYTYVQLKNGDIVPWSEYVEKNLKKEFKQFLFKQP